MGDVYVVNMLEDNDTKRIVHLFPRRIIYIDIIKSGRFDEIIRRYFNNII